MSIKTLRKHIAVVAVSVLTAGVVSVASTPVANATIGSLTTADAQLNAQVCTVNDTLDTAVTKVGGVIKFTVGGSSYADFTGPGEFVLTDSSGVTFADGQAVLAAASDHIGVKATAVGTIKVTFRSTSTGAAAFVGTITAVASCSNGTPSTTYSFIQIVDKDTGEAFGSRSMTSNVDQSGENVVDGTSSSDGVGYIRAKLRDVYNNTMPSTGAVQVSATGDVTIGVTTTATTGGGVVAASASAKSWIASGTGEDLGIAVAPKTAGVPTVSTITITYDSVVVATKTITFLGAPSKVTYVGGSVGKSTAGTNVGTLRFKIVDSAGNPLGGRNVANDGTFNAAVVAITSGITAGSTTDSVTGLTPALTDANAAYFTCTTKGGVAQLQAKVAVDAASTEHIYTSPFAVACGGTVDTWSISLDKATYAPGEIATLTVSAKDADGHGVYSALTLGTVVSSFGGMEFITSPTSVDTFSSALGAKTYSLRVLTTEGSYVGSFKITGDTDTSAKTVQYKVASSTPTTSMADVLKSVVALIASINKQIQALQKLILRR